MPKYLEWSPSLRFHHKNLLYTFPIPHRCYVPLPPVSLFLIWTPNNICRRVQIMKFLVVYSAPLSCYLGPGTPMISGSLSPRRGASSGCGWRNGPMVAANILNKQSRTADKCDAPVRWSGKMPLTPDRKNMLC